MQCRLKHTYIHSYKFAKKQQQNNSNCDRNDHFTVLKAWLRKTLSQTKFCLALDLKCHFIHIYIIVILIKSIIAK